MQNTSLFISHTYAHFASAIVAWFTFTLEVACLGNQQAISIGIAMHAWSVRFTRIAAL